MSLLTAEQQARLDAAAAEAALARSQDAAAAEVAAAKGKPHRRHKATAGNGCTWGSVFDSCAPPIIALDKADPNYDASEQRGLAFAVREVEPSPELDSLASFRAAAQQLLRELFASGDVAAAAAELRSLEAPWLGAAFVRWAVSLSLDRGDAEKELAARLLCAVSPDPAVLPPDQLQEGFARLLEGAQELAIDVPDAPQQLGLWLARAVVDDLLPPSFLARARGGCEAARAALSLARARTAAPAAGAQIAAVWGGAGTLAGARAAVRALLCDYWSERDAGGAAARLAARQQPFFAHEAVYRALLGALEAPARAEDALHLLSALRASGAASAQQLALGFARCAEAVGDLELDVPGAGARWAALQARARAAGLLREGAEGAGESEEARAFKAASSDVVLEYLAAQDADEAARLLSLLLASAGGADAPLRLGPLFIKRLLTHAADRGARAREAAAQLISRLVRDCAVLPAAAVEAGLELLLQALGPLSLDVPDAPELALLFILRAIVDGAAGGAWLAAAAARLRGSAGGEAAAAAAAALAAKEPAERAMRAWLAPAGEGAGGAASAKASVRAIMVDYLSDLHPNEACRLLFDLKLPFYMHAAVYCAAQLAVERGGTDSAALAHLVGRLAATGVASAQQLRAGLARAEEAVADWGLDTPEAAERWAAWRTALEEELRRG